MLAEVRDAADGSEQCRDQQQARGKVPGCCDAPGHKDRADCDNQNIHHAVKHPHGCVKTRHIFVTVALDIQKLFCALVKLFLFHLFVCEGFHHADSEQAVLGFCVDLAKLIACLFKRVFHFHPGMPGQQIHHRHHGKNRQRQPDVHGREYRETDGDFNNGDKNLFRQVV